jgi:hypothetical protein
MERSGSPPASICMSWNCCSLNIADSGENLAPLSRWRAGPILSTRVELSAIVMVFSIPTRAEPWDRWHRGDSAAEFEDRGPRISTSVGTRLWRKSDQVVTPHRGTPSQRRTPHGRASIERTRELPRLLATRRRHVLPWSTALRAPTTGGPSADRDGKRFPPRRATTRPPRPVAHRNADGRTDRGIPITLRERPSGRFPDTPHCCAVNEMNTPRRAAPAARRTRIAPVVLIGTSPAVHRGGVGAGREGGLPG